MGKRRNIRSEVLQECSSIGGKKIESNVSKADRNQKCKNFAYFTGSQPSECDKESKNVPSIRRKEKRSNFSSQSTFKNALTIQTPVNLIRSIPKQLSVIKIYSSNGLTLTHNSSVTFSLFGLLKQVGFHDLNFASNTSEILHVEHLKRYMQMEQSGKKTLQAPSANPYYELTISRETFLSSSPTATQIYLEKL
jgi:hypothetical protein